MFTYLVVFFYWAFTTLCTPIPQIDDIIDEISDILEIDLLSVLNITNPLFAVNILDPNIGVVSGLSYWVNSVGQTVQYGDMVWGPEDLLLSMKTEQEPTDEFYIDLNFTFTTDWDKRSFGRLPSLGWKNGIIPYRYSSTAARDIHQQGVQAAIAEWKSWAPYLAFEPQPTKNQLERDIVTITSIPRDGCHSNVGWSRGSANDWKQINFDPTWEYLDRAYRHEFGHQLGLVHEHMRPDRNKYLNFDCSAVQGQDPLDPRKPCNTDCCKYPKSPCCYYTMSNFEVWNPQTSASRTYGAYDYDSVMHYPSTGFAKAGQATLTKKSVPFAAEERALANGKTYLPERHHISRGDAVAVCGIYSDICKKCFPNGVPATNPNGRCE
ncbi:hypothetical protein GQ44DRAFT_780097 [Phaeosphaeriaceae sp. PMI808]|nr:hypothetical protein GQ44DRAFT_780097 [Phaeosphaeriaceae sp. PMI808]